MSEFTIQTRITKDLPVLTQPGHNAITVKSGFSNFCLYVYLSKNGIRPRSARRGHQSECFGHALEERIESHIFALQTARVRTSMFSPALLTAYAVVNSKDEP